MGYDVTGFDNVEHVYGEHRYPANLVVRDILTIHGRELADAALIVASPPCQAYSWRAMPWKAAKAAPPPDNSLFEACFRIQREAIEAAGHFIPLVIENVKGAQKWVGRARWNYGSFYLWGDVPALMPITFRGFKSTGMNWSDRSIKGQDFTRVAGAQAIKNSGGSWFAVSHNNVPHSRGDEIKVPGGGADGWFGKNTKHPLRQGSSGGQKRKFASAMIAKIPRPLSEHIARSWWPASTPPKKVDAP